MPSTQTYSVAHLAYYIYKDKNIQINEYVPIYIIYII